MQVYETTGTIVDVTPYIIGVSVSSTIMVIIFSLITFFYIKFRKKKTLLKTKGKNAEEYTANQIQFWAYKNNAMYMQPTMFKYHNNKLFEVDGIVISQRALIVVEVKHINAQTIVGKGNEKNWYKILGSERHPIKSPILQNDRHLNHIVQMTGIKVPMVSLIIFDTNGTKHLDITDIPGHVIVITSDKIQETLDGINSFLMPKITANEVQNLYFKLMDHKTTRKEDKKLLIAYAKEFNEKTFTI